MFDLSTKYENGILKMNHFTDTSFIISDMVLETNSIINDHILHVVLKLKSVSTKLSNFPVGKG